MDSYTFSSDSTSSFFVKETSSDESNLLPPGNGSYLHVSSKEELCQEDGESGVKEILKDSATPNISFASDFKDDPSTMTASDIFIITIDENNPDDVENSSKFVEVEQEDKSESNTETVETVVVQEDVSDFFTPDSGLNELFQSDDVEVASDEKSNEQVGSVSDDKNVESFDMEHFLSFKRGKGNKNTKDSSKSIGIIKKYFLHVGSNMVQCSLCSDKLVNNMSNLLLHLRLVHRSNKKVDSDKEKGLKLWNHFTKVDAYKAKCNLCSSFFIYKNRVTNLIKHLRIMHKQLVDVGAPQETTTEAKVEEVKSDATSPTKDFIVIQTSKGKLLNQIKVETDKSWKCFTKLPNSDSMICNLCKTVLSHNKPNVLIEHLRAEHKSILSASGSIQPVVSTPESAGVADVSDCADENKDCVDESYEDVLVGELHEQKNTTKSAKVWQFFTQLTNGKVSCNLCKKTLSSNYSTSNLLRHLKSIHSDVYNSVKGFSNEASKDVLHELIQVAEVAESNSNKVEEDDNDIFKHFTKLKKIGRISKVKCNECKVVLTYNSGLTFNLSRHLKLKHNIVSEGDNFQAEVEDEDDQLNTDSDTYLKTFIDVVDDDSERETVKSGADDNLLISESVVTTPANIDESFSDNETANTSGLNLSDKSTLQASDDSPNKLNDSGNKLIKNRSKAWEYFTKCETNDKAICNICSVELKFRKDSLYSLFRHISRTHNIVFDKIPKPQKVFVYESDVSDVDSTTNQRESKIVETNVNASSESDVCESESKSNSFVEAKGTSRAWKHFTKLDIDKAKCNSCDEVLTYKMGQISDLIKHIQLSHKSISSPEVNISLRKRSRRSKDNKGNDDNDKSDVWEFFTKLEWNEAMCNICEFPNIVEYTEKSYSNLRRHLRRKHNYSIKKADTESASSASEEEEEVKPAKLLTNKETEASTGGGQQFNDVKTLFDYLICDDKLKNCIKFENDLIKCRLCSGIFFCENLIKCEYTVRYHVQIFHAEWTVNCIDESAIKRECPSPISDTGDQSEMNQLDDSKVPVYNELQAIENEVTSFIKAKDKTQQQKSGSKKKVKNAANERPNLLKSESYHRMLNENVWKYFTKLTSQNVRCNFCSILLSFRQNKKWNLLRHLKLKHKSKIYELPDNVNVSAAVRTKPTVPRILSRSKSILKKRIEPTKKMTIEKKEEKSSPSKSKKHDGSHKGVKEVERKSTNVGAAAKKDDVENKPMPLSLSSISDSPASRKFGRTWSHFTKIEMGSAQCNICGHLLFYKGSGTDTLNDHLTKTHADYFDGTPQKEVRKSYFKASESNNDGIESDQESLSNKEDSESTDKNWEMESKRKILTIKDSAAQSETDDGTNNSRKSWSPVWQYFTRLDNGYAKCHLCLSEISYRGTTSNLMRHLQKVHSVISLLSSENDANLVMKKTESEKSKLLAAVNLTPTKVSEESSQLCYIRINKKTARCNFCQRVLHHKYGSMHKLMSHLLHKHKREINQYKSFKNLKFHVKGKDISLVAAKDRRERFSAQLVETPKPISLPSSVDKRKIFRSNTWLYFTKLTDHHAKCNKCFNTFSYKGGSIYNLTRHLLIKHDVKLIKRKEMSYKKLRSLSVPTARLMTVSKKKETLLFFKRVNRNIIRCKLCLKRFLYNGVNIGHLVNHLWSKHISKLVGSESGVLSLNPSDNSENGDDDDFENNDSGSGGNNLSQTEEASDSVEDNSENNKKEGDDKENRTEEENTNYYNNCNKGKSFSGIWNYFIDLKDADCNVKCKVCQKGFCFRSRNFSNLARHLETHAIKRPYIDNADNDEIYKCFKADQVAITSNNNNNKVQNFLDNGQFALPFTVAYNKGKNKVTKEVNELLRFFTKVSNDVETKVQCKVCKDIVDYSGVDGAGALKAHLSIKHSISDTNESSMSSQYNDINVKLDKRDNNFYKFNYNALMVSSASRMKCKLCSKEFTSHKSKIMAKLIEHLRVDHDLPDNEKQIINMFCKFQQVDDNVNAKPGLVNDGCVNSSFENGLSESKKLDALSKSIEECDMAEEAVNSVNGENKNDKMLDKLGKSSYSESLKVKHLISLYYKNLRHYKDKCKVCNKFVSVKRPCLHRITNDLCMKYGVRKIRQKMRGGDSVNDMKRRLEHFTSINLYENKCFECMEIWHDGYCLHSLNLWIMNESKKKSVVAKPETAEFNPVLTDKDVQMITDSLGGCTDNIIIITNDENNINYELSNNEEGGHRDYSYQIVNSINDIDDEDVRVIIYDYQGENMEEVNEDGVKIQEITEGEDVVIDSVTDNVDSSNNVVVEDAGAELNDSKLEECNNEGANQSAVSDENLNESTVVDVNGIVDENTDLSRTEDRTTHSSKLTELAEVSCNEQFYKQNSLINHEVTETELSSDVVESTAKSNVDEIVKVDSLESCIVETIYPENDKVDRTEETYGVVEKDGNEEEKTGDDDAKQKSDENESCVVEMSQEIQVEPFKEELQSKNNEVFSEEVINAIFNEVIGNFQSSDKVEVNAIKLVENNIEMPSGLYFQDLVSSYKISKSVLHFDNIDHEYKVAKCNLCDTYLQFMEPIIYNLLMHLFTHHKEKVCTEDSINRDVEEESTKVVPITNKGRRKSQVWKYFSNENNFRATCKICCFSFSFKGGAINNLSRHLRLRHNIVLSSSIASPNFDAIVTYPKKRSVVKLRSKTWMYFTKEPNDWAKCKICSKYLSYRSSTINNLTRHLRTIHSDIFNCLFNNKEPVFIKNEDGSVSENAPFTDGDGKLQEATTKTRDEILQRCSYTTPDNCNKRKSIVWNYFTEFSPNLGKCNFCSKVISCKGGGTSNLSRHLRSKHGIWIVLTSNLTQSFNELNHSDLMETSEVPVNQDTDTIITQEQLHILKNRKAVHKKSKTWEYFTKETADRVSCNLCLKVLSYKCKAVHNLRRHLLKKHPEIITKPEPIRLKLQITPDNVLHNSNELEDSVADESRKFIDITDTSVVIVDEENRMPPSRPDRNSSRPKKSIVWNYFEEIEYGVAKCLICSKVLSFRGGGTNNLMRHLRCRHSIIIINHPSSELNVTDGEHEVYYAREDTDIKESVHTMNGIEDSQEKIEVEVILDK